LVVGGIVLAPKIILSIYSAEYAGSILTLQILIIMAALTFLCRPFSDVIIVSNQQKKAFWVTFWGAVINIILNLILIPKYSLNGAAVATVITYIVILIMYFLQTMKFTPINPISLKFIFSFIISAVCCMPMYFVIAQPKIYNLNVFLSVTIGTITYFATFFALKFLLKRFKTVEEKL